MTTTQPHLLVRETDRTGATSRTYIYSTTTGQKGRFDLFRETRDRRSTTTTTTTVSRAETSYVRACRAAVTEKFAALFLPVGYPNSVTADYTAYQIYDSCQAFASTIASLLSARAVLQSLALGGSGSGFGSGDGKRGEKRGEKRGSGGVLDDGEVIPGGGGGGSGDVRTDTATYATLVSILQSTLSNLMTIAFASHASPYISSSVKHYRFLADIVNDLAFILDCLLPALPSASLRIPALCLSSTCRAICGVAGGSSKAVLSAHFAKNGSDVGELNAKDGSQETVVTLLGMWVGGVLVSYVDGRQATWLWMVSLLCAHLWFNYCAVKSVRLRGLNVNRASEVLTALIGETDDAQNTSDISVDGVGSRESILDFGGDVYLKDRNGKRLFKCIIGADFADLLDCMNAEIKPVSKSVEVDEANMSILDIFEKERYVLCMARHKAVITFKDHAQPEDQLKAWCHALVMGSNFDVKTDKMDLLAKSDMLRHSLQSVNHHWSEYRQRMIQAGWDLELSTLESSSGKRVSITPLADQ